MAQDFNLPEKVLQYEQFLSGTLREDLKRILDARDKVFEQIAEYNQLSAVITKLKEADMLSEELKTKVDLGCNFYVQAKVPDSSRIFVFVGFGFFVEFTLDEALKFIEKRTAFLTKNSDKLTKDANKVKAHIKLVLEALREIQKIPTSTDQPPRDIWS